MRKLVAMYPYKTKFLCITDNHLYTFPLRSSFWSRLAEVPHLTIERVVREAEGLTRGFSLHDTKKQEGDKDFLFLILTPFPFCVTIFKKLLEREDELPSNIYVMPPVVGAVDYYVAKKYGGEETTLLIHSENRMTSFVVLERGVPSRFLLANQNTSHRTLRTLEPDLNEGETVYVFSGEENHLVANCIRNPKGVARLNEEEALKGAYLTMLASLSPSSSKNTGTGKGIQMDMGEEK